MSDWHRLLIGQAPWSFMVEIVFRAVVTYVILLVAMRLMGKRIGAQRTRTARYSIDGRHELR